MKAIAIIGANYGDEGKGLTIDYLARQQVAKGFNPLIVRFNGGAQASHTVTTPDGKRHAFSHLGAASFLPNARTYLSSRFIINGYALHKELTILEADIPKPIIYAHPNCMVTTIVDMALNSIAELVRGSQRHGSCGMGINETVTRTEAGFTLWLYRVKMMSVEALAGELERIFTEWVPQRLEALGLTQADLDQHELYANVLRGPQDFKAHAAVLKSRCEPLISLTPNGRNTMIASLQEGQEVLLEGAQGLALDEQLGAFPHVTRSITGLTAAVAVAAYEIGALEVEPLYITRSYLTRHGAGPLEHEGVQISTGVIRDMTNVENMWQGSLRFAPLNLKQLCEFLKADMLRAEGSTAVRMLDAKILKPKLMLTCLDQLGEQVNIVNGAGELVMIQAKDLPLTLARELGRDFTVAYCSYGPKADNVKTWI